MQRKALLMTAGAGMGFQVSDFHYNCHSPAACLCPAKEHLPPSLPFSLFLFALEFYKSILIPFFMLCQLEEIYC